MTKECVDMNKDDLTGYDIQPKRKCHRLVMGNIAFVKTGDSGNYIPDICSNCEDRYVNNCYYDRLSHNHKTKEYE